MSSQPRLPVQMASSPPPPLSPITSSQESTLVGSSCSAPLSKPPSGAKLLERAENIARMTSELKLHKVIEQANNVQRDLRQLSKTTHTNDAFRQQNESRMEKLWLEILAVRAATDAGSQLRAEDRLELKECRREVADVKSEMDKLKGLLAELSRKMDRLPTLTEANAVLAAVKTQREACEGAAEEVARAVGNVNISRADIHNRIRETIKSTKRWHLDHKTTGLSDAVFTARYLKKQSRRDPGMAVFLQKAIQRRIRDKGKKDRSPRAVPQTLEAFCEDVLWADVTATVEDVLVRRVECAVRSLSQSSGEGDMR
ncbi:hypothetical protein QQS21_007036 [Conoideocrella luteorostrata]|uniref:Uncharacterized protein n=1 Tax=Conoideocrella luteorostrata TaxID=1105319 RepID=A0AAJ0CP73_9HYPO|nr:hypothetical protein QQS21_007036 [Conoideocrella luteorostrata]